MHVLDRAHISNFHITLLYNHSCSIDCLCLIFFSNHACLINILQCSGGGARGSKRCDRRPFMSSRQCWSMVVAAEGVTAVALAAVNVVFVAEAAKDEAVVSGTLVDMTIMARPLWL